jgi:hypothetical protein
MMVRRAGCGEKVMVLERGGEFAKIRSTIGEEGYVGLVHTNSNTASPAGRPDFGIQVYIVETQWGSTGSGANGWGRGNLKNGSEVQAFDFTYSCGSYFLATQGSTYYPAKWKKEPTRLLILASEIGGSNQSTCELKTTLMPFVYVRRDGQIATVPRD